MMKPCGAMSTQGNQRERKRTFLSVLKINQASRRERLLAYLQKRPE
jgi:hypothetical protein